MRLQCKHPTYKLGICQKAFQNRSVGQSQLHPKVMRNICYKNLPADLIPMPQFNLSFTDIAFFSCEDSLNISYAFVFAPYAALVYLQIKNPKYVSNKLQRYKNTIYGSFLLDFGLYLLIYSHLILISLFTHLTFGITRCACIYC